MKGSGDCSLDDNREKGWGGNRQSVIPLKSEETEETNTCSCFDDFQGHVFTHDLRNGGHDEVRLTNSCFFAKNVFLVFLLDTQSWVKA